MLRTGELAGAAKLPMFAGQGLNDAQAAAKLGDLAFAHGITGMGQVGDVLGQEVGGNILQRLPGALPGRKTGLETPVEFAKSFVPTSWEAANPLAMRGVGGQTASKFAPALAGEAAGQEIESMGRLAGFIGLVKQGYTPDIASAMTKAAHVDYSSLTSFERNFMRRVAPFYSWLSGNVPYQLREIVEKPGGTIANAISSPPTTWSVNNSARWASASATSGALTMTTVTSGTDGYYNGTKSAGYYSRNLVPAPGEFIQVFRLQATIDNDGNRAFVGVAGTDGYLLGSVDFRNSTGTRAVRYISNDTTFGNIASGLSAATCANGYWFALVHKGNTVEVWYNTTNSSTEPTSSWLFFNRVDSTTSRAQVSPWLEVMGAAREVNTGATGAVATVSGYRTAFRTAGGETFAALPAGLDSTGFSSASDVITLRAWDLGSAWLPSQSRMRLLIADAENRLPGDAASWTWSLTGSDSAGPAAATNYQASSALTLKVPGTDTTETVGRRYWTLRAKCASSSSTQTGSIDTALIRLGN